jgi:hypothetical protein
MALYGLQNHADNSTVQFSTSRGKPGRARRIGAIGAYMIGVVAGGATLAALFTLDAVQRTPIPPRWLHCIGAISSLVLTCCIAAALRSNRRTTQQQARSVECRTLESQAESRSQFALLRAEMLAHLGMLPEWADWRDEQRTTETWIAAYQELAKTGTDDRPAVATVTQLHRVPDRN